MEQCRCGRYNKSGVELCLCGEALPMKVKKKTFGINKISTKQKSINEQAKEVHKKMATTLPKLCSGCGKTKRLTHSHLIPRSQRPLLQNHLLNLVYHCMTCHPLWEHDKQKRKNMLDYHCNMTRIKIMDISYYNLIVGKHGY